MSTLTESPAWQALLDHRQAMANAGIAQLFAADPQRLGHFSVRLGGLSPDYSKKFVKPETLLQYGQCGGLALGRATRAGKTNCGPRRIGKGAGRIHAGHLRAADILPELDSNEPVGSYDASTNGLIDFYKANRDTHFRERRLQ